MHSTSHFMELVMTRDSLVSMRLQAQLNSHTDVETELPHSESQHLSWLTTERDTLRTEDQPQILTHISFHPLSSTLVSLKNPRLTPWLSTILTGLHGSRLPSSKLHEE